MTCTCGTRNPMHTRYLTCSHCGTTWVHTNGRWYRVRNPHLARWAPIHAALRTP